MLMLERHTGVISQWWRGWWQMWQEKGY